MRKMPDLVLFEKVLLKLPDADERLRRTQQAGELHQMDSSVFQCCGANPQVVAALLKRLTDNGHVPEALRLAHLIGSAVMLGESTKRA